MQRRELEVITTDADLFTLVSRYKSKLEDAGAAWLGNGVFATTYSSPNDRNLVIKVGCNIGQLFLPTNGLIDSDGYLTWIKQCLKYPTKHVPRILRAAAYVNDHKALTGVAYVVIMERLESALNEEHAFDEHHMAQEISPLLNGTVEALAKKYRQVEKSKNPHSAMLGRALGDTWTVAGKDLHRGNWMVRVTGKTKTAVITDPAT